MLPAGPRAKWAVVTVWVLLAAALAPLQPRLQDSVENDPAAFLPADAESTQVREMLENRFTEDEVTPALIVFQRPGGLQEADREAIRAGMDSLEEIGGLGDVVSPFGEDPTGTALVSPDGTTAVATATLPRGDFEELGPEVDRIEDAVQDVPDGLEVYVTGPAGLLNDIGQIFGDIDRTLLLASTVLILTLLLAIYRSPLTALVPFAVVGSAYLIAAGLAYALLQVTDLPLNGQTTGILVVLMFGAGTDYCLLILARYRDELRFHSDRHDAMAASARRTTPAILSSGGTVLATMLVLLFADLESLRLAGPVWALGIGVIMLAGLTLLPALLAIGGRTVFWPRRPRVGEEPGRGRAGWERVADLVARRPRAVLAVTALLLAGAALGNLTPMPGLSSVAGAFRDDPRSVQGVDVLARALPPGQIAPADVIVAASDAETLEAAVPAVAHRLRQRDDVADVASTAISEGGNTARLQMTLAIDPYSDAAIDRISGLRRVARQAAEDTGARAAIGGSTAEDADTRQSARRDFRVIAPAALALIFLILAVLLRALVAPLLLVVSQIAGFAATLGISLLAFRHLFGFEGVDESLRIYVFIFTVALGVDYSIFLIARIREEAGHAGTREGVRHGLVTTGGVITSAGIILAGTFSLLMILPLVVLWQVGFAVAVGVMLDTFVVRSLVVPACGRVLGRRLWWPGGPPPPPPSREDAPAPSAPAQVGAPSA
jgi:putative drug exporter of the RND superfamily